MNANHIKSTRDGYVYATATILHQGSTTQVWDIKITDDKAQLISVMWYNRNQVNKVTKFL